RSKRDWSSDVCSSDLSAHGPAFDLPTVLSKLLAVDWSLFDVIAAATVRPCDALGIDDGSGTLQPGTAADIAVFDIEHGTFEVFDVNGSVRQRSEEHTSELQSRFDLVCRLLLENK